MFLSIKESSDEFALLEKQHPLMSSKLRCLQSLRSRPLSDIGKVAQVYGVDRGELERMVMLYQIGGIKLLCNPNAKGFISTGRTLSFGNLRSILTHSELTKASNMAVMRVLNYSQAIPCPETTVHIWRYRGKDVAWGHAPVTLSDGTHISWWPNVDPRDPKLGEKPAESWRAVFNSLYEAPARTEETIGHDQSFDDDMDLERDSIHDPPKRPDVEIKIKGLNEESIKTWWKDFKKNNKWQTLGNNCSWVTINALIQGAKLPMDYWRAYAMPHTPNDAERFAKMVQGISTCS